MNNRRFVFLIAHRSSFCQDNNTRYVHNLLVRPYRPCMAEGYLKPSLVLSSDFLAGQFFDCLLGPIRCNGDPHVSSSSLLGYHMKDRG